MELCSIHEEDGKTMLSLIIMAHIDTCCMFSKFQTRFNNGFILFEKIRNAYCSTNNEVFMKILITVLITMFSFSALADYTMVILIKPGSGTSQWASIVAKHMEKHLDEKLC